MKFDTPLIVKNEPTVEVTLSPEVNGVVYLYYDDIKVGRFKDGLFEIKSLNEDEAEKLADKGVVTEFEQSENKMLIYYYIGRKKRIDIM